MTAFPRDTTPGHGTPRLLLNWQEARDGGRKALQMGAATYEVAFPSGALDGQTVFVRDPNFAGGGFAVSLRVEQAPEAISVFLSAAHAADGGDLRVVTSRGPVTVRCPRGVRDGESVLFDLNSGPLFVTFRYGSAPSEAGSGTPAGEGALGSAKAMPARPTRTFSGVRTSVAIGVLALIGVAVGVPAVGSARYGAKKARTLGEFRLADQALLLYAQDADDRLPTGDSAAMLEKARPFAPLPSPFRTENPNGGAMTADAALAGKPVATAERPSDTRLLFDSREWPSRDRASAYLDGHVKFESRPRR